MNNNLIGIEILDPGHLYKLGSIDGQYPQVLQFVKRYDPQNPWKFPGNNNCYPGTTLQIVIRALLDRIKYLQNQVWCLENSIIKKLLQLTLWLLEIRAARRHKRSYWHGLRFAAESSICMICGHTVCDHKYKYGLHKRIL